MPSTNKEVIQSFLNQTTNHSGTGNLTTDGTSLHSYRLEIARWYGGKPMVFDYTATGGAYRSQTTSQHVGLAKREVPINNIMLVEFAKKIINIIQ
jgi:hypothetical protein|tara:strand:- start:488 stop:772 length:285 start_codon:yes stop_codon:yes gene_type:complete